MTRMSGATALLQSLIAHDVDTIFGLPGGQLDHFFDSIYHARNRINLVASRHEQGAAYMAYGYARSTGKVGVYTVVPGPGVLNTTAALCTAYACNAPVLCLTGQIPSHAIGKGTGELHEIPDQLATLRTLTKWAARIDHPSHAPERVAEAFHQMKTGRPRPVALEMAMDVMAAECPVTMTGALPQSAATADPELVSKAAKLIANAKNPMIYVGGGAIPAADSILALAEAIEAPVVSFRSGRGVVSDEHYLGFTLPAGYRYWPRVDLVIGIGSRMMEPLSHWGADKDLKIIRIDIDPAEMHRSVPADVSIVADSALAVPSLLEAVEKTIGKPASRKEDFIAHKAAVARDIQKVQPQMSFLEAIREELPRDGIFVDEITQCGFASWYGFPVYKPRQHINCGYQGTLGYGYATALGVKVANPDKAVVSIAGDGGFMFNVQELATAVQYNIGVIAIVFNSDSFTNVQRQQREWFDNHIIASDLHNPDFVKLAESFGARAYRATTPAELRAQLKKAMSHSGPALIEVPVGDMATPWEFIICPPNRPSTT